jgi:nucleoside-diphosphate-sugar epimerase
VSSIHPEDAAAAVVAALHVPAGTYNIVDDEPMTRTEYAAAARAALSARIRLPPAPVLSMLGSRTTVAVRSVRVSNRRFREVSGWSPRYRSVREGFAALAASGDTAPVSR